jgi:hypothetical protein
MEKVFSRKNMARTILIGFVSAFLMMNVGNVVLAADTTTTSVLPGTDQNLINCQTEYNPDVQGRLAVESGLNGDDPDKKVTDWLGCGIKTGNIKLYMVPYYVRSVLEFVIGISGLACVGAIIVGGFSYLFAGISEDKEKGKKAIQYGLIGMVLTLLSWAIVNIVMTLLTM